MYAHSAMGTTWSDGIFGFCLRQKSKNHKNWNTKTKYQTTKLIGSSKISNNRTHRFWLIDNHLIPVREEQLLIILLMYQKYKIVANILFSNVMS